jgi:hypothetical protein
MLAFRTRASVYPEETVPAANLPTRRERLAIVSTGSKLCGVAAYTAALHQQLSEAFDVTVFDLDQYLLRSTHRRIRDLGDKHIKHICREIARFDAVNLQLEHGILGHRAIDIYRRFCWLAAAAPRFSVTFHTMLTPPSFESRSLTKALLTLKWRTAERIYAGYSRHALLSRGIARRLRRLQRWKQVSAIVHNRRDLYDVKYL